MNGKFTGSEHPWVWELTPPIPVPTLKQFAHIVAAIVPEPLPPLPPLPPPELSL